MEVVMIPNAASQAKTIDQTDSRSGIRVKNPAPHFQLPCATVRDRLQTSQAVHSCGVGATPKFRGCSPLIGTVRRIGYRLATRIRR